MTLGTVHLRATTSPSQSVRIGRAPADVSVILDCVRWVCAALVVISHLRSLLFADFGQLSNPGWIVGFFYFVTGFGYEAVVMFFVLSGYLVGGDVLAKFRNGSFDARSYAAKRIGRLYAVYVAALLLGGLWDVLGSTIAQDTGLYRQAHSIAALRYSVVDRLSPATLAGNVFFLQQVTTTPFGSNEPLWSLANEAWYYALFPLGLTVIWPGRADRRRRLVAAILFLASAWLVRGPILLYFSIWLLGVAATTIRPARAVNAIVWVFALAATLLARRSGLLAFPSIFSADIALATVCAAALNFWGVRKISPSTTLDAIHRHLAGFSYSVYLLHWPFLLCAVALCQHFLGFGLRSTSFWPNAILAAGMGLVVYAYCWLVSQVTEKQTPAVRAAIDGLLRRLDPTP